MSRNDLPRDWPAHADEAAVAELVGRIDAAWERDFWRQGSGRRRRRRKRRAELAAVWADVANRPPSTDPRPLA